MQIIFHGHACFSVIANDGTHLIIDPFIQGNPMAKVSLDEVNADVILLTHGHSDHFGDALALAKKNNALIIAPFELAMYCQHHGATNVHPLHIGGSFDFDFGRVKLPPALHGSSFIEGTTITST